MLKSVRPPASGLLLWNSPRARRRKTKRNFSTSWTTRGEKLEQFPRTCYRRTTTYIRRVKRLPKPSKSNFDSKHSKQRNGINTSFIDKKLPTRLLERLSGIQPERASGPFCSLSQFPTVCERPVRSRIEQSGLELRSPSF